jgi:site-specific DNA-cytosine methylase
MRVLSLFDGMGGARQALKNLEVEPELYCTSEVNPHSMKVAKDNFPYIREFTR